MPNGGHISCGYCLHDQHGRCEVYGVETSPFVLCRMFRIDSDQSFEQASERWTVLEELKPGTVYCIKNDAFSAGNPKPMYVLARAKRSKCLDKSKGQD